ncbi:thioredoxin [Thioalkalivibrio paradoxus]|uniref:Thioredoxin n=1 Tax=Thioalkalivibrio paradoxus ARh 1 TaxID=713585 RepID=W0DQQ0_9GAMM|nr:thioredoxin [Thioalkalivibrio paradoxus]AHE99318.1 thioredoxin [Thioalkalivibrio paradoxus ARh 1]
MAVQELTQENFESTVTGNDIVIVDFWAPWCAPCRSFAPIFEAASDNYPDVVFAKVNTEEQQALAGAFQIRSIPTLMIFREQVIIFSQPGMLSATQLEDVLGKARELDMAQVHEDIRRQQQAAGNGGA